MQTGKVYSLFGNNGAVMEEIKRADNLPLYCKIYCYGAGMSERMAAIISTANEHEQYTAVFISDFEPGFTLIDKYCRPHSKKFGIGRYFDDDLNTFTAEEVQPYILKAQEKKVQDDKAEQEAKIKAEQRQEYLKQFKTADVRTTTNIIKRHILKTFPTVSKVEVRTDSYSGGSSMDVTYHAPEKIKELESFIKSFQYGHFNSMEDIYEYSKDREVILEGYILNDYKYVFSHFKEAAAPDKKETQITETQTTTNEKPLGIVAIMYSEKSFAIFGNTKPIKDTLAKLGGKFNARLTHPETKEKAAGWIFHISKLETVKTNLQIN